MDEKLITLQREEFRAKNPFISNKELAYQLILNQIVEGKLAPGEKLVQDSLSCLLGMSRSPIRDALIKLEEEGYLNKKGNNTYYVYEFRLKDYVDYCEVRIRLESYAASLAARNITADELRILHRNLDHYGNENNSIEMLRNLDHEFHTTIIQASRNPYIINFNQMYAQKKRFFNQYFLRHQDIVYAKAKHLAIYNALVRYDEKAAEQAMISHLENYIRNLYDII